MEVPPIRHAISRDGTPIAYVRYLGSSPSFLQVNTPGAPPLSLRTTMAQFAGRYPHLFRDRSGIIFDARGTGDSGPIQQGFCVDDMVDDLDAVAAQAGGPVDGIFIGRAAFAGCLHAARNPERYRSIWIVGGSLRPGEGYQGVTNRPGWERGYSQHLREKARSYYDISNAEAVALAVQWEARVPAASWAAYLEAEQGIDLTRVLPGIRLPAWVSADRPIDFEAAATIASMLPDATFTTYETRTTRPEHGDFDRDEWDRHLGRRLGEAPSCLRGTDRLSPRERQILDLVTKGLANADIAATLHISTRTVENHIANIYAKLGVHNRVEAANWAREHGAG